MYLLSHLSPNPFHPSCYTRVSSEHKLYFLETADHDRLPLLTSRTSAPAPSLEHAHIVSLGPCVSMSRDPLRFFTPTEVRQHAFADDAYVSLNGKVLDLTVLIATYNARPKFAYLTKPLVQAAGSDISHWWDPQNDTLKTCVDINTGMRTYTQPMGRFPHVPTIYPDSNIDLEYDTPWWKDPQYIVGELTSKTRKVRIVNTLNGHEVTLEVCAEETLNDIVRERYLEINAHAHSYTWRRLDPEPRDLDMTKTLDGNNIADETEEFEHLGLNADFYIPAINLYYNDDLTEA